MDEHRTGQIAIVTAGVVAVTLIVSLTAYFVLTARWALEHGYVQGPAIGQQGTVWTKPKE